MSNEQVEVLIEEVLQLRLELTELRRDVNQHARSASAPPYIAVAAGATVILFALLVFLIISVIW
jgi:hypothetical protein